MFGDGFHAKTWVAKSDERRDAERDAYNLQLDRALQQECLQTRSLNLSNLSKSMQAKQKLARQHSRYDQMERQLLAEMMRNNNSMNNNNVFYEDDLADDMVPMMQPSMYDVGDLVLPRQQQQFGGSASRRRLNQLMNAQQQRRFGPAATRMRRMSSPAADLGAGAGGIPFMYQQQQQQLHNQLHPRSFSQSYSTRPFMQQQLRMQPQSCSCPHDQDFGLYDDQQAQAHAAMFATPLAQRLDDCTCGSGVNRMYAQPGAAPMAQMQMPYII